MTTFIAVVAGLILGSFLSVLLDRWPHWRGAAAGRSHCPNCMHELAWYDLIPLVSWAMLRGACRYCGAPISKLYPALEVTMAAVLGIYAYRYGVPTGWYAIDYAVLFALVSLFFFDLKHRVLPDAILLPLGIVLLIRMASLRPDLLVNAVAMGLFMAAVLGLLYAVSRGRWLGFGDVKLALVLGLLFGYPGSVGVTLAAIWAGALVGIVLMALHRANMQTALPFGSFWVATAILALIWPSPFYFMSGLFIPALR